MELWLNNISFEVFLNFNSKQHYNSFAVVLISAN
jgi:hypothetical protein